MMLRALRDWVWLERAQWLKKEQLADIQDRRLRDTVRHAFQNVPLYRRLYSEANIDPTSVTNARSIGRLPVITKQQARDVPLEERTAIGTDLSSCTPRTTSGATGIPITILEEPRSAARRAAIWLRRFQAYGVKPLDKACMVIPGGHRRGLISDASGFWGFVMSRKVRGLSLAADIDEQIALISKWKPDVLVAPASHYRTLIRFSEQEGQSLSFKVAIANGEMLDGKTRRLISDKFHTDKVFETYGAAEVGPIAWECPTHTGYHLNAESLIAEFLRDGEPVAPGEPGEICVTNLYRRATPMIRYLVGDVVTFVDADCPCGRGLPLIKDKQGRLLDFILTRRGRHVSPFRVMHMLEDVPGVARYKVVQKSDYSIVLLVETMKQELNEQMLSALRERCAELFGELPVDITLVDRIENPKGQKFQIVESQIARQLQQTSSRVA